MGLVDKLLGEKGRWKMAIIGLGKILWVALICQSLLVAVGLGFPNWSRLENADDPDLELNRLERKFYANLWPSYLESNSDGTQMDEQSDELTENIKKSALVDQSLRAIQKRSPSPKPQEKVRYHYCYYHPITCWKRRR